MDEDFVQRQTAHLRAMKWLVACWFASLGLAVAVFVIAPSYRSCAVGLGVALISGGYVVLAEFEYALFARTSPPSNPLATSDLDSLIHSRQPYCLYLRNFGPERNRASVPLHMPEEFTGDLPLRRGPRFAPILHSSIEHALSLVLRGIKLIMIENPSGNVLPIIDYVKCANHPWENVFTIAAANARLIVIACDEDSCGLRYELTWLSGNRLLGKVWLISAQEFLPILHRLVPSLESVALAVTAHPGPLRYVNSLVLPEDVATHLFKTAQAPGVSNTANDT